MTARLDATVYADLDRLLAPVDELLRSRYPGEPGTRQPLHTCYVPADRFDSSTPGEWGVQARAALEAHAPDPAALAGATGLPPGLVEEVHPLVLAKLAREPVEDLRVDFEDGYAAHPPADEDAAARAAGTQLAAVTRSGAGPAYLGIRIKSLEGATRRRGVRTLDLVLGSLAERAGPARLPAGFVVTLPKVSAVEQVAAMAELCGRLEQGHGLGGGALRFEVQVEMPQAVCGAEGMATVARMIDAAAGRCTGLHYGTYDYSAACAIPAAYQSMEHPVADHAKAVMQVAAAGTGVRLSDGSTNVLPVGDREQVHAAWRLHARLVRRSLERGFYQGWDLHPAQLVTRYLATYAFYRSGLPAAATRLRHYLGDSRGDSLGWTGQGDQAGGTAQLKAAVLDEPATAQALAGFLVRGLDCGAVTDAEVTAAAGTDRAALARLVRREPG